MQYDFDTVIDRTHTNSAKWAVKPGELPMTTADMDFKVAPEITEAMKQKVDTAVFGYEYPTEEYFQAVQQWYEREHHAYVDRDWMRFTTGVIPAITASVHHFSHEGDSVLMMEPIYNTFYNIHLIMCILFHDSWNSIQIRHINNTSIYTFIT
mgnify:CR=1 FL=1